jgi:hypothetical protein
MKRFAIYLIGLAEETYFLATILGLFSGGIALLDIWLLDAVFWPQQVEKAINLILISLIFILWGCIGLLFWNRREAPIFIIQPIEKLAMLTGFVLTLLSWGIVIWIWILNWEVVISVVDFWRK